MHETPVNIDAKIKESFFELTNFLEKYDPVKLVTQLTLTFLFIPEDKHANVSSESEKWGCWIEFVVGFYMKKIPPTSSITHIDGAVITSLQQKLEAYFLNISTSLLVSGNASEEDRVLKSAKYYSLYVRGEAYQFQYYSAALELYEPHNMWFEENLGFTVEEAIHITKSIEEEYNRKINELLPEAREEASKAAKKFILSGDYKKKDEKDLTLSLFYQFYFAKSDIILGIRVQDVASISGFSIKTCQKYLDRMSQTFGYKNFKFLDSFTDPIKSPWDYNTIYEKPFIEYEGVYWLPIPHLLPGILFNTFNYDFLNDQKYAEKYAIARGKFVEKRTYNSLVKIFGKENVFLNPFYPQKKEKEFSDVLVLFDRKVFIFQCKSKGLTHISEIGEDFGQLKSDLKKGVRDSFEQAIKAKEFLNSTPIPELHFKNGLRLCIEMNQVSDIFLVSVTLGGFQNFITRLANTNSVFKLFEKGQYPWAVSLFDLEDIIEILDSSSLFIHYLKRRLGVEHTVFDVQADEIDLLGVYLHQGLNFGSSKFKDTNLVGFPAFSNIIDSYIIKTHFLGVKAKKPSPKWPRGFKEIIKAMEGLDISYNTDCIIKMLDLDYQIKNEIVESINRCKKEVKSDHRTVSCYFIPKDFSCGISFHALDAEGDFDRLLKEVSNIALMKKYQTRCKEWAALGWDKSTNKIIDLVQFMSFEHVDIPKLNEYLEKASNNKVPK